MLYAFAIKDRVFGKEKNESLKCLMQTDSELCPYIFTTEEFTMGSSMSTCVSWCFQITNMCKEKLSSALTGGQPPVKKNFLQIYKETYHSYVQKN